MGVVSRIRRPRVVASRLVNRQASNTIAEHADRVAEADAAGYERGKADMADRLRIRFSTLRETGQFDYRATPVWDAVFDALDAEGGTAGRPS